MFAEHDYLTTFAEQIGAETKPPIIDDLEPESVIESTYFSVNGKNHLCYKEPVMLQGFQAVTKPSKFGYTLQAVIDDQLIRQLEVDRTDGLKWAESKLKNPKRSTLRHEPWEEVAENLYKVKFAWGEDNKPPIVDMDGTPVDEETPIYEGALSN